LNLFKNNSTPERPRESRHILERVQKIMQSGEGARRTGMIGLLVRFTAAPLSANADKSYLKIMAAARNDWPDGLNGRR
jgi:hypothetical protein